MQELSIYSPSGGGGVLKKLNFHDIRFKCQQSGHCCCDPGIIVTLTFHDVYRLYQALDNDFEFMVKKLTFYKIDSTLDDTIRKRLVLEAIQTTEGDVIPGLKKVGGMNCVFYTHPNCTIYHFRPRACRNYPFAFLGVQNQIEFLWAKNAEQSCPGIEKGSPLPISELDREGHKTLADINSHNDFIKQLNIEARSENPLSAREAIWIFIVYGEKIAGSK